MPGQMLTSGDGPVVVSEVSLRALLAIRKDKLLAEMFGEVAINRACFEAMTDVLPAAPPWLVVMEDRPAQTIPERVASATASEAATLRLALAIPASLVVIDGPIKEKAKLSFIKCEGVVSLLVQAYRDGRLSAVQPMVKALDKLGHGHVLPPPHLLDALWKALDAMA
jgi:predicted nucleic acid-binding protein